MAPLAANLLDLEHVESGCQYESTRPNPYGWKIVDGKLECDWESVGNREAVRQQVGLLFRGCSCSSVTACSTRRYVVPVVGVVVLPVPQVHSNRAQMS